MTDFILTKSDEASEAIRAVLHEPTHHLIAPEVCSVVSHTKPLYYRWPDLLDRLADQVDERASLTGLRHDEGLDAAATAAEAASSLRNAAAAIRAVGPELENAHNALSHLADDPDLRPGL